MPNDTPAGDGLLRPSFAKATESYEVLGAPALHQRKHLRRLDNVFENYRAPLYFLTICVSNRRPILNNPVVSNIIVAAWKTSEELYGWRIGRYVLMPDHVHFFTAPVAEQAKDLSSFVGSWKNWTRKQIRENGLSPFAWQREFFDHLLRNSESSSEKWEYVRLNPVRAGLVSEAEAWPYQGEIHRLEW